MQFKLKVLVVTSLFVVALGQEVRPRGDYSKDIEIDNPVDFSKKAGKAQSARQGRFFGLLSLLAGLSLSEEFLFDSDTWADHHKGGVNINTKLQTSPYGFGWPYGPRYVPVLIPASYLNSLKYSPGQKPPEGSNQQIVNIDSPVKKESYKEVTSGQIPGQKNSASAERFTREAAELQNRADMDGTGMETNATVEEILVKPMNQSENLVMENEGMTENEGMMEIGGMVENVTQPTPTESTGMSQSHEQTTPVSFEVELMPEIEHLAENLTINELEKPSNWIPTGNSSYYRKYPTSININDIHFTTLYPPLGTPPPDHEDFQASPEDESHFRRAPDTFQPVIQVPIFWRSR